MKAQALLILVLSASLTALAQETANKPSPDLGGSGSPNHLARWRTNTDLGSSIVYQSNEPNIGIGISAPKAKLDVNGTVNSKTGFNLEGFPFAFGSYANANSFLGFAGNSEMTGDGNTAVGWLALNSNVDGTENTACGVAALARNTSGSFNVACGANALLLNTTASSNTAFGAGALSTSTIGGSNSAVGNDALYNNNGNNNVAFGVEALYYNTAGSGNTALGSFAGVSSLQTTGSNDTFIGYGSNPVVGGLTNATAIGYNSEVGVSNALVLGGVGAYAVNVGIGTAAPSNVFTIVQGSGHAISDGWDTYSSRRWKTNVQTLHDALTMVEQLRGVSYDSATNSKHEIGVIAEEVGAVVPEIVSWDSARKEAQGVDYGRLTALLIEATKEQQILIRQQRKQLQALQAQIDRLQTQVSEIRASVKRPESEARTLNAGVRE